MTAAGTGLRDQKTVDALRFIIERPMLKAKRLYVCEQSASRDPLCGPFAR